MFEKRKLQNLIRVKKDSFSLRSLLSEQSDDFWFWLLTDGRDADPGISNLLPTMPAESIQLNFTGKSGKATLEQAFSAYKLFKNIAITRSGNFSDSTEILDFGCGWGRIIRFFLKDLEPSRIHGADCYREMIDICKNSNMKCDFLAIDPMPPIQYPDEKFDVIYLYSVFSHLSESAHLAWLGEFQRILKPGGVFIATTRPAEFIDLCRALGKKEKLADWERATVLSFPDPEKAMEEYSEGNYVHRGTGGGGVLDKSFYGETCISEKYMRNTWSRFFSKTDYITAKSHRQFDQNVLIGIK